MIVLACTIHDPQAGLKWLSDKHVSWLLSLFDKVVIVSSPFTSDQYLLSLKQSGPVIKKRTDNRVGRTYFEAIQQACKFNPDYVWYCDFDRILHWSEHFPSELKKFVKFLKMQVGQNKQPDYVVCERTRQGYLKHHTALYETEQIANMVISHSMKQKTMHDFLSGSFVFSRKALRLIQKSGPTSAYEFFGHWPVLLQKNKMKILWKKFHGLEWETPNQNREAVQKAGGVEAWRESLSSPQEWERRTKIARSVVKNILSSIVHNV